MQQLSPNNGGLLDSTASPLQSMESEEAFLGSILINEYALDDPIVKSVTPSEFYGVRNAWVYEAILALHERGEQIDNITVIDELRQNPERFSDIGGSHYLTFLINSTPIHIHASTYALIIKSTARRRQAMTIAQDIANAAVSGDPSEFELAYRRMEQIVTQQKPTGNLRGFFFHVSELDSIPRIGWLIEGQIPERGLVVIFGQSGIGKSFFALDYAMRLAQAHSVIYIAGEGQHGFLMRTTAWTRFHRIEKHSLDLRFCMNIVSLLEPGERGEFINIVRQWRPQLIVVDTLALSILPGDENNTRDMGLFVRAAHEMSNTLGCAVLLVHHTGKEGKRERGNYALRAAADVMIRLTEDDDVIMVECSKTKDAEPFPTRYVRRLPVETEYGSSPIIIEADKVSITKDDPLSRQQRKVLDALALEVNITGASNSDIANITEIGAGSISKILSKLIGLGFVRSTGEKTYEITKQGLDKLGKKIPLIPSDSTTDSIGLPAPRGRDSMIPQNHTKKFVQPRLESMESLESVESVESDRPSNPCPTCGQMNWAKRKFRRGYYCVPCADSKAEELTATQPAPHPKDQQIIASASDDETHDDDDNPYFRSPR